MVFGANLLKDPDAMSVKTCILVLWLSVTFLGTVVSQTKVPVSWSGTVVDLRTGNPIAGAKVYGGASGRVDLTEAAITDAEGRFTVTYQDGALDLDLWKFYRLTVEPPTEGPRYFGYISIHGAPLEVTARLLPLNGFYRGVVRNASNQKVISGATVSLGAGGRYIETLTTDPQGEFTFNTEAYDPGNWTNYEIGIDPENQLPHEARNQPSLLTNHWLEATAEGYQRLQTAEFGLNLSLISSITDDIHTFVSIELSPIDTSTQANASFETIDPTLYLQCSAAYFSENQLTDPGTSG